MGYTFEEVARALTLAFPAPPETPYQKRVRATLAWVEHSCARDGLPDHLIRLVAGQVQGEINLGRFPLIEERSP